MAALALAVVGCASVTMAPEEADREAKRFVALAGLTRIYVTRPGTQGAAGVAQMVIDGRIVGSLPIQTYLFVDVPPGDHSVSLFGVKFLPVRTEAGRCYFFRPRDWGLFRQDTDEEGRDAVTHTALIQTYPTP